MMPPSSGQKQICTQSPIISSFVGDHLKQGELVALQITDLPVLSHEPLLVKLADRDLDELHLAFVRMVRAQWQSQGQMQLSTSPGIVIRAGSCP